MPQLSIKVGKEDCFNVKLDCIFDQFPKYHMKILSRVRRLYKMGIGLTTGFIGLQLQLHLITVYTLYNSLCSL
jgi:hypothetical protein